MQSPPSERRLHPASILFQLASQVRQLLLPGLFVLFAGARGGDAWQLLALVLVVPFALVTLARTLVFRYRLEADDLVIQSGLIFRQQRHVPYERVQNIDAIQNVFHRAFRVVEVRLETAGGQEPEGALSVISLAACDELRARVLAGRRTAPRPGESAAAGQPAGDRPPAEPATTLLTLPARELVICGLVQGRGLLVLGAAFGLFWEAGLVERITDGVFGDALAGRRAARQVLQTLSGQGLPAAGRLLVTATAIAAFLLVTRIFSVGWALIRLHGFTLRRAGDDLRADFGLLTRVTATVPMRRIQSVTVHEGPLHRLFDRVSVRVETAGGESGAAVQLQRQWLAPVVPAAQVPALLRAVLPSVDATALAWQPVEGRGVRRMRVRGLVKAAVVSLLLAPPLGWWSAALFAALALPVEVNARRSVRALGWATTATGLFFRSGWLWRRQTVSPLAKVQVVAVRESPFDRRHRMATLGVDTAGTSAAGHRITVPYLSRATAAALAGQLAAQAARTAFRW